MEESRALRRRRPEPEPGPRLLPVVLAIVVIGFAIGAGGKLLYAHFHHPHALPVGPRITPTPNYALMPVPAQATQLPPIPTPQGTWYVEATLAPFRVKILPTNLVTPHPTPRLTASPSPQPTAVPTAPPSPLPTPSHMAKVLTKHKYVLKHHVHPHPAVTLGPFEQAAATPHASVAPTKMPALATPEPVVVATPRPPAAERLVRRYLASLIRGDEATAYTLLGAAPGNASLSEESFINTSAHVAALNSTQDTAGSVVHAEIETASGLYFATYHVQERNGKLVIVGHEFIKP